jgi:hypothetical protein
MRKVICPYCNRQAEFTTSEAFYGRDYGTNIYVCRPCNAYVGTHKNSDVPMGSLATKELREMRQLAHSRFDFLWKVGGKTRTQAYKWMANVMGLKPEEAHIGQFNLEQCKTLIRLVHEREEQRRKSQYGN